jgi:lipoprotein-anchoring transpeptidase ErfK/SrfK
LKLPAFLAACVVVVAGAAAPALASGVAASVDRRAVRPLGARGPLGDARLSDERSISRYAGATVRAPVRALPDRTARRVGRLRYLTEDGPFEVYPVLESHVDARHRTWLHVRLPERPNGQTGWVPRNALGELKTVRSVLHVNRASLRAALYRDGRRIWSAAIGVGKPATPTPAGHFWIRSRLRSLRGDPTYGPYAFGTGAYSALSDWPGGGVIGLHGTDRPDLIPGRPSHGCIRMRNQSITSLWRLLEIGTPVVIV